ncbi:MAG TPA: diguanylate cyclase, partial [Polyangiaceae bacterium]|nr:diguanylate cyclase [Polyangiaceae bacterium]
SGARVLVVDPDQATRAQLVQLGREKLLVVVAVATPASALAEAARGPLDAVFIDASLGPQALALAHDLRAEPGRERLPLAFLSVEDDVERRVAAAHAGASLFLPNPVDPYAFGAAAEQMLALGRKEKMRVLIVDDDPAFVTCVIEVLEREGIAVHSAADATRLVDLLDAVHPDLVLLDAVLPHVSGWDAIRIVRTAPEHRDVPILFLTGRTDVASRVAAFEAGADDYLGKPLVNEELLARVRVRLDRRRLVREVTERDQLTRCLSRRALLDALTSRLSEARRHGRPFSVAMIDVDRFKRVNDAYGHLVGDHVLMALGRLLNARFRLEDLRGRWGGEEFVLAFPGELACTAAAVLSRVLDEFRALPFRSDRGERFYVTFSAGVASFPNDGATSDALIRASDVRLYGAKRSGRGNVVVAPDDARSSDRLDESRA